MAATVEGFDPTAIKARLSGMNDSQKNDVIMKMIDSFEMQAKGEKVVNPGVDTGTVSSSVNKSVGADAFSLDDPNAFSAWQRWEDPGKNMDPRIRDGFLKKSLHEVGYRYQGHWDNMGQLLKDGWSNSKKQDFVAKHAESFDKIPQLDMFLKARGMNTIAGSEGGFLVNPEIAPTVDWLFNKSDIPGRIDTYNSTSPRFWIPRARDLNRNDGTRHGGVFSTWIDEGRRGRESFPEMDFTKLEMKKLAVFVPMTHEIMNNSDHFVEQYVRTAVREEINFAIARSIVWGEGGVEPTGFCSEKTQALITVLKTDAAQPVNTFTNDNALAMLSQLYRTAQSSAVWLHHQSVIPQLGTLTIQQTPIAVNHLEGGVQNEIIGTLYNRPLNESELCAPLGDPGDVMLADLKAYKAIAQSTVREDVSMHVEFMTDQSMLRFIFNFDGKPLLPTPITPFRAPGATADPPLQGSFLRMESRR